MTWQITHHYLYSELFLAMYIRAKFRTRVGFYDLGCCVVTSKVQSSRYNPFVTDSYIYKTHGGHQYLIFIKCKWLCFSGDDEKAKRDAGKWWKPWVSQPGGEQQHHAPRVMHRRLIIPEEWQLTTELLYWRSVGSDAYPKAQCTFDTSLFNTVENNCGYHLFESDTEEEEEEVTEKKEEEEPPKKKSAFQVRTRKITWDNKNKTYD